MSTGVKLSRVQLEPLADKIRKELPNVGVIISPVMEIGDITACTIGLFPNHGNSCILCVDCEDDYNAVKKFCLYVSEQLNDYCSDTHNMSFVL